MLKLMPSRRRPVMGLAEGRADCSWTDLSVRHAVFLVVSARWLGNLDWCHLKSPLHLEHT